jgi:hypothetical protein
LRVEGRKRLEERGEEERGASPSFPGEGVVSTGRKYARGLAQVRRWGCGVREWGGKVGDVGGGAGELGAGGGGCGILRVRWHTCGLKPDDGAVPGSQSRAHFFDERGHLRRQEKR